jgi:hypothetical protein
MPAGIGSCILCTFARVGSRGCWLTHYAVPTCCSLQCSNAVIHVHDCSDTPPPGPLPSFCYSMVQVCPDSATAQRSRCSGKLVITMPKEAPDQRVTDVTHLR